MSVSTNSTGEKIWTQATSAFGHRRRNSSSCLFTPANSMFANTTKYSSSRYLALSKLHSDSTGVGLNALRLPSLPRGTLFRSSLPATPLSTPMYTSIFSHFTEQDIHNLLDKKSSTPKVLKKLSQHDFLSSRSTTVDLAQASSSSAATADCDKTSGLTFDDELSHHSTSIVTRATVPASYKIDSKSAKEQLAERPTVAHSLLAASVVPDQIVEEDEEAEADNSSPEPTVAANTSVYLSADEQEKKSDKSFEQTSILNSLNLNDKQQAGGDQTSQSDKSDRVNNVDDVAANQPINSQPTSSNTSTNTSTNTSNTVIINNNNTNSSSGNNSTQELHVAGFDLSTTENDLFRFFSDFVHVESVRIIHDRVSKISRGFGFVKISFPSDKTPKDFLPSNPILNGKHLKLQPARSKSTRNDHNDYSRSNYSKNYNRNYSKNGNQSFK